MVLYPFIGGYYVVIMNAPVAVTVTAPGPTEHVEVVTVTAIPSLWCVFERSSSITRKINFTWWRHQLKKIPRYWHFVRGIYRSPVDSPYKGQWRRASMFSLICAWTNGCANNRSAGDLRRHRAHYDVTGMKKHNFGVIIVLADGLLPQAHWWSILGFVYMTGLALWL